MELNKIIQGDTLTELEKLPAESIDMIISSPPYYALRNYGVDGQLGLEKTFDDYKAKILEITAELKRILKKSGQLWWNMGDIYCSQPAGNKKPSGFQITNKAWGNNPQAPNLNRFDKKNYGGLGEKRQDTTRQGRGRGLPIQDKCLLMMPERIALEMIDKQGWILRNKIKWVKQVLLKKENITKGSVMPTSVKDRFNESGEELYFFVKNKKYYSNLDAVRLKTENNYEDFNRRVRDAQKGIGPQFRASEEEIKNYGTKMSEVGGQTIQGIERKRLEARMADTKNKDQKSSRTYNIKKLLSEVRLGIKPNTGMDRKRKSPEELKSMGVPATYIGATGEDHNLLNNPLGKNLPSVWLVGSEPHNFQKEVGSSVDHFAIFPQALLDIPIRFGSPRGGIILDPFFGSGTTGVVAIKNGRNYLGIELNEDYIKIAEARIKAASAQQKLL